jgi:hypothetical protein
MSPSVQIADKLELASETVSINIMPVISTAALTAMAEGMLYPPLAQLSPLTHLQAALGYSVDDFEDGYVSANVQIMSVARSCPLQPHFN